MLESLDLFCISLGMCATSMALEQLWETLAVNTDWWENSTATYGCDSASWEPPDTQPAATTYSRAPSAQQQNLCFHSQTPPDLLVRAWITSSLSWAEGNIHITTSRFPSEMQSSLFEHMNMQSGAVKKSCSYSLEQTREEKCLNIRAGLTFPSITRSGCGLQEINSQRSHKYQLMPWFINFYPCWYERPIKVNRARAWGSVWGPRAGKKSSRLFEISLGKRTGISLGKKPENFFPSYTLLLFCIPWTAPELRRLLSALVLVKVV